MTTTNIRTCSCALEPEHAVLPAIDKVWASYTPHSFTVADFTAYSVFIGFPEPVVAIGTVLPTDDGEWFYILTTRSPGIVSDSNYATANDATTALIEAHGAMAEGAIRGAIMEVPTCQPK